MHTQTVDYQAGDLTCEGYLASNHSSDKRPVVVICHAWAGLGDEERGAAHRLADLGYVAFAADVFGKGVRGDPGGDNSHLIGPLMGDRALLKRRLEAAVQAAKAQPGVDAERVGAIGYCFGGLCALDMARGDIGGVKGVVSFHGLFAAPGLGEQAQISSKVLICHGWNDPLAPPKDVLAVAQELTAAKADWQLNAYGHAMHAFTVPAADSPDHGMQYNEAAAHRSWAAMEYFLKEALR